MEYRRLALGAALAVGLAMYVEDGSAQGLVKVCYVPNTGVMYLIDPSGTLPGNLPADCRGSGDLHLQLSWASLAAENGNVGIGVPEPTVALDISGDIHATGKLKLGYNTMTFDPDGNTITSATNEDIAILPGGTGKVGIGTTTPGELLTVAGAIQSTLGGFKFPDGTMQTSAAAGGGAGPFVPVDGVAAATDGFAVTGTRGTGTIPASGAGTRLMWYPNRAAFRVGSVSGAQWSNLWIGESSTAMGEDATASGRGSTAMGFGPTASGLASTATGQATHADGEASAAMGLSTSATGHYSVAMGKRTIASGEGSVAMGGTSDPSKVTTATGLYSVAMGDRVTASEAGSVAMGQQSTASGTGSVALGQGVVAGVGFGSIAIGRDNLAFGSLSIAIGTNSLATGDGSVAIGTNANTDFHQGAFVYGSGQGETRAPAPYSFTVKASGGATFFSNATLTQGVRLAPGAGAWSTISDRNRKREFEDVDGEAVLASIAGMPVQEWSYLSQDPSIRHLGPTAQDFYAAFGLGSDDVTITTSDIDGVNMLAVQALEKRTRELQAENHELRERLERLEAAVRAMQR